MTKNINYIIDYYEGRLSQREMRVFEKSLTNNKELQAEYLLYCQVNEYMRGRSDLEDVKNDPTLQETRSMVNETIYSYNGKPGYIKDNREFVTDALNERIINRELQQEIDQIKKEIDENNVNEISDTWVNEWIENSQDQETGDPRTEELREFIHQSLEPEKHHSVLKTIFNKKAAWSKATAIRVVSLMAASLLVGAILFRSLVPSGDPEKLYAAFYNPMVTLSPVTRGLSSDLAVQYNEAIELYNKGNYALAASMFQDVMVEDAFFMAPAFFYGITQMELGNYSQSVSSLSFVVGQAQEYMKEAQWYLGLSYLKIGDTAKAIPYFKALSESEGFYRDQAGKLLRRLK